MTPSFAPPDDTHERGVACPTPGTAPRLVGQGVGDPRRPLGYHRHRALPMHVGCGPVDEPSHRASHPQRGWHDFEFTAGLRRHDRECGGPSQTRSPCTTASAPPPDHPHIASPSAARSLEYGGSVDAAVFDRDRVGIGPNGGKQIPGADQQTRAQHPAHRKPIGGSRLRDLAASTSEYQCQPAWTSFRHAHLRDRASVPSAASYLSCFATAASTFDSSTVRYRSV